MLGVSPQRRIEKEISKLKEKAKAQAQSMDSSQSGHQVVAAKVISIEPSLSTGHASETVENYITYDMYYAIYYDIFIMSYMLCVISGKYQSCK